MSKIEWNFNDTSLKIHHENLVSLTFLYYMVKNNPSRCLKNIFIIQEGKLNKLKIRLRIVHLNNKYNIDILELN